MDTGSGTVQEIDLDLEYTGGYKASAHVEWYAPRDIEPSDVLQANHPDLDNTLAKAIRVTAEFAPETVNGFEWPSEIPFGLLVGYSNSTSYLGGSHRFIDEAGSYIDPTAEYSGPQHYVADGQALKVAVDIFYTTTKSPNFPDGDWENSSFANDPVTVAVAYCDEDKGMKGVDLNRRWSSFTGGLHHWGSAESKACWLTPESIYADPFG